MISVLNNVSSLIGENALSATQASLQNTLTELSTGLRLNSGAQDPAGISIANGLGANIAALTQSSQNASNGVGFLQTADGALSQVTSLLNQAVTIATEASNGGLTPDQATALNNQFTAIYKEIDQIGSTTNFNGTAVFSAANPTWDSQQGSASSALATTDALTNGSVTTITDSVTGGTFVFTAGATSTIGDLQTAISDAATDGTLDSGAALTINANGQVEISTSTAGASLQVSTNDAVMGPFSTTSSGGNSTVFTSDGTSSGSNTLSTSISALSSSALSLSTQSLTTTTTAKTALTAITDAISTVAKSRGAIGSAINSLTHDEGVENTEVQNLTSAQNNVQNADIGTTVANMTQYNVLEQTGMAALSQSNAAQQSVLKLLQ